jgi:hypothetical protein
MTREAWLFTRGDESIRILRNVVGKPTLVVYGPGRRSHSYPFDSLESRDDFLGSYLTQLEADGWVLHATVDRRQQEGPLPPGGDRRQL